jgi:hypothetical protein
MSDGVLPLDTLTLVSVLSFVCRVYAAPAVWSCQTTAPSTPLMMAVLECCLSLWQTRLGTSHQVGGTEVAAE